MDGESDEEAERLSEPDASEGASSSDMPGGRCRRVPGEDIDR